MKTPALAPQVALLSADRFAQQGRGKLCAQYQEAKHLIPHLPLSLPRVTGASPKTLEPLGLSPHCAPNEAEWNGNTALWPGPRCAGTVQP